MKNNLISKIFIETKIINSAAKANNIDIVLSALENRKLLYDEFGLLSDNEKKQLKNEMSEEIEKIKILDESSMRLLKKFNEKLKIRFAENSVSKSKLKKGGAVNKKYLDPYSMINRSRFDAKF